MLSMFIVCIGRLDLYFLLLLFYSHNRNCASGCVLSVSPHGCRHYHHSFSYYKYQYHIYRIYRFDCRLDLFLSEIERQSVYVRYVCNVYILCAIGTDIFSIWFLPLIFCCIFFGTFFCVLFCIGVQAVFVYNGRFLFLFLLFTFIFFLFVFTYIKAIQCKYIHYSTISHSYTWSVM